jgi:folate-binding protein YgfZ
MTPSTIQREQERLNAAWSDGLPSHYGSAEAEYRQVREACGWLDFSRLAKLKITGDDRKGWLQGQVTNDLRPVEEGSHVKFCVLSPTGQIVAACDLWALPGEFIVTFDEAAREATLARLERMLILEDVTIEDQSEAWGLVSIQGPGAAESLASKLELPRLSAGMSNGIRVLRSNRTGSGGWDILFGEEQAKEVVEMLTDIAPIGRDAWEILRIEAGIPVYGKDMNDRTLAMEMGPAFIESHISFGKGCYTGQEVVERIRSRGHTNRQWVGLLAESPLSVSEPVTSAAVSPTLGPIAAAMLRSDPIAEGHVMLGEVPAEVVQMPLTPYA